MAKARVVRDPIYGYIELPGELAPIVDHALYQRLRRIAQTSLTSAVYPTATGSRFEHGLGTMHLAMRGWSAAWRRADEDTRTAFRGAVIEEHGLAPSYSDVPALLRLAVGGAALLHDVGHPPFSHVLEPLYEQLSTEHFGDDPELMAGWENAGEAYHEFAGKRLSATILREIPPPLERLIWLVYCADETGGTWAGAAHSIIAGEVDVDRLDYLMRDAQKAGTEFGAIDYARLVDALELRTVADGEFKIAPGVRARSAVETLVLQRTQAYKWISYHSRVVGANLALRRSLEEIKQLGQDHRRVSIDHEERELAELFAPLWPALSYVRPRWGDLERRLRAPVRPAHESDPVQLTFTDQDRAALLESLTVELQAYVDDSVVIESIKDGALLADVVLESGSLAQAVRLSLERLRTYAGHAVHRSRNCIAAWKTVEQFESTCRRLAGDLSRAVADAYDEAANDVSFQHNDDLRAALTAERMRVLQVLSEDPTVGTNQLITGLFAGEDQRLRDLATELYRVRHEVDHVRGFWDAAYTGFEAVRGVENGAVLFTGDEPIPLFTSSALARALAQVERSRYRLCVYFFVPNGLPFGNGPEPQELREKLVGEFVTLFPDYVRRVLPTVLFDSFARPEPTTGAGQ